METTESRIAAPPTSGKTAIRFTLLVFAAAIVSALLHELGHCVFYWLQGIPAAMSLTKEYPLRDITAMQYAIGSVGGPFSNMVQIIVAVWLYQSGAFSRTRKQLLSAFIFANVFYFILRGLVALLKRQGGELDSAASLIGLDYRVVVAVFFCITLIVLYLWIKASKTRITLARSLAFVGLFFGYFAVMVGVQVFDEALFWHKFPTIQIDDGRVYNAHRE
jgi:hypothetical protein